MIIGITATMAQATPIRPPMRHSPIAHSVPSRQARIVAEVAMVALSNRLDSQAGSLNRCWKCCSDRPCCGIIMKRVSLRAIGIVTKPGSMRNSATIHAAAATRALARGERSIRPSP